MEKFVAGVTKKLRWFFMDRGRRCVRGKWEMKGKRDEAR